jgi:prepilin-type N-terminal cleavage/methylation domain-containing protein/prepilin-type processing-associated H-X9-DG protein
MNANSRAGLSLIELLVCIFIVALLAALLIPAVQQVREAARAAECRSKLHQVNLAIQNYVELHQFFPTASLVGDYSYIVKILPQLDQAPLAAVFANGSPGERQSHFLDPMPMLLCPSEPGSDEIPHTSYYMNYGTLFPSGSSDFGNGFFDPHPLRPRDVLDGLSHTAIVSEIIITPKSDPRTHMWILGGRTYQRGNEAAFADDCDAMPRSPGDDSTGLETGWAFHLDNRYYHFLPPNHRSCKAGVDGLRVQNSGSRHPGMAHTAYADGSVHVTSSSSDRSVWQALGSRNGGEPVR